MLDDHPTLELAQLVGEAVKQAVTGPFRVAHATLKLECESCNDELGLLPHGHRPLEAHVARRGRR